MSARKIVIDGKTYHSVDEMPEDVRRNYEEAMRGFKEFNVENFSGAMSDIKTVLADKNNNGTPDIFEGNQTISVAGQTKFIVDGRTYNNLDELPAEARAKYEHAMSSLDRNQNGMPDFLEGAVNLPDQTAQAMFSRDTLPQADTSRRASYAPLTGSPAIAPDTSNGLMLAIAGLFVLTICALGAIGVWYFFLR
ncbi:MAG: hypothetical protein AB1607_04455 [Chloroflexota bacterium]